jgi:hypothetical protein
MLRGGGLKSDELKHRDLRIGERQKVLVAR